MKKENLLCRENFSIHINKRWALLTFIVIILVLQVQYIYC